jgi:hypothetical protein
MMPDSIASERRTIELMTTNQVGLLHSATGLGFGLGFETPDRFGANGMDSVFAFGWGGTYGILYPWMLRPGWSSC